MPIAPCAAIIAPWRIMREYAGMRKEARMMTAYDFKFVIDTGLIVYICAPSRKEAIKLFCEEHGCDDEYIKNHVVIRRCRKVCG